MQFVGESSSQRNFYQEGSSNPQGRRLDSKFLPSVRRLGKGLSGYFYETTWEGKKYVRKDFPLGSVHHNVFEKEANALLDLDHPNIVRCPHYTVGKSSCSLLLEYVDDDLQNIIQKKIEAQGKGNRTGSSTILHSRVLDTDETRSLMSSMAKRWEITGADVGLMKMPENEPTAPFEVPEADVGLVEMPENEPTAPFEVPEALDIIFQIATGVKYLHDNGIVHGDLKPQNVLVGHDGIVKLVDFGLVETKKRVKLVSKRTRHFEILLWKAPERFEKLLGPVLEYSDDPFSDADTDEDEEIESSVIFTESRLAMADVFSFGLVCSQVLGGKLMYSNLRLTQLREERMDGFRPQLPSSCPDGLQSLIFSSVDFDPGCRPIFADICKALEAFQSNQRPRLMEDRGALEMVLEPIPQVRQALEVIKHVCAISSTVRANKQLCKRLANRFSAIGGGLKGGMGWDKNSKGGKSSDGSNRNHYPALDELLTVLRKGEALISSYVGSKGPISVVSCTDNRESFKEIHEELDTLKAQFDFESFSELGQVEDFESSSGIQMTNALAEDAEKDLTEMPKDLAQIKNSKNTTEMDIEEVDRVVLEKSDLLGPRDELPSYLKIDLTAITIAEPVRPVVLRSKQDKLEELGWAVVHLSKWIGFGFAAKVFKSPLAGWNNKQLLMEVGSLANLQHPHIVRLVGFGQDAEQCVFLMELMDTDLRNFMREKLQSFPRPKPRPFKRPEELDIIIQIAKSMHYMHTQQYAHGNLKCSHILVKKFDDYLDVKITGLRGSQKLGKTWDAEAFRHASQTRRPRWTAPEAIEHYGGKEPPSALLRKSDVYSFGMTCYEVVTGKYPFDGIAGEKLLKMIHAGERPELPGDLNEDLTGLIRQCWDPEPNKRPGFGEIIYLLNHIRSKEPTLVWNNFYGKDMVQSLMKNVPKIYGVFREMLGQVRQGKEHSHEEDSSDDSWEGGKKGDGGFHRSDDTLHLSVPENLRIQPDNLNIVRLIGWGFYGNVYEATWLGCTFAVKVFKIRVYFEIRALQREVVILININHHPCIVQMVGLSVNSNQQCCKVMELMDGNLGDLIESRVRERTSVKGMRFIKGLLGRVVVPFELHKALPIISKIALGMSFLHSKGVVHRDLKSWNVLVKEHPESIDVKLAGFGLSLHEFEIEGRQSYCGTGTGTGFWRAPEVLPGGDRSKKLDLKAADVYSFAMTCYEVLTGKKPFSNLRRSDYTPVVNGERPTLPALLHPGLKALVQQCWHADPVKRPEFTEICEELKKIQLSLPS